MAGERCRGIEHDDDGARFQQVIDGLGHLADVGVRHSEDGDLRIGQRNFRRDALYAEVLGEARAALFAHFNMTHRKRRVLEIARETVAHFAAGSEESD